MAQIQSIGTSYPDINKLLKGCNAGYRYKAKQGLINLNLSDNAETPQCMSEEEIKTHIMGVVLINHFNTKKGINIFGDRSETAVMKELQKIHDMNTYKQMDVYTMTYQERKDALRLLLFVK